MGQIFIIDEDSLSRKAMQASLQAAGLEATCTSAESAGKPLPGAVYLLVEIENSTLPVLENDRFARPVRVGAMLDRVRYHAGQAGRDRGNEILAIGPYDLDAVNNDLMPREGGDTIRLTEKERQILEYLARYKNEIVDRRRLLDAVWGYVNGVETHTLETHIYRLRQKIEADPAYPEILMTEGQGYRLRV